LNTVLFSIGCGIIVIIIDIVYSDEMMILLFCHYYYCDDLLFIVSIVQYLWLRMTLLLFILAIIILLFGIMIAVLVCLKQVYRAWPFIVVRYGNRDTAVCGAAYIYCIIYYSVLFNDMCGIVVTGYSG